MLVLGRKSNESIVIGDDIVVTVLGVEGDRVKIGIKAPSHISIFRHELYETVKQENLRAAKSLANASDDLLPNLKNLFENDE